MERRQTMKKIEIITIYGLDNYGNKLQNYALQETLKKIDKNFHIETVYKKRSFIECLKEIIKYFLGTFFPFIEKFKEYKMFFKRRRFFIQFSKLINTKKYTKKFFLKEYTDYEIIGSDQVWNINFTSKIDSFNFSCLDKKNCKKISYAASFGVTELPDKWKKKLNVRLSEDNIKWLSVREDAGKKIIEDLNGRSDVKVLIDPAMLLSKEEWSKVSKKPNALKSRKYILNYFLGGLSLDRKKEIERIAKENNCEIINILDKNGPFYISGPSEFLYFEEHAFLICTDSFHSCVFAILYNRPFIIFEREDNFLGNMNSRFDTLIHKFHLKNRRYNGKNITQENLVLDYKKANEILEEERKKSIDFLKNALEAK